jgi:hypothetical protein
MLESQRDLLLLSHPLSLFLQWDHLPVFELSLQILLLDPFLDLLALSCFGVLVIEANHVIHLIAHQFVLEIILFVLGNDLLVDIFRKFRLLFLRTL